MVTSTFSSTVGCVQDQLAHWQAAEENKSKPLLQNLLEVIKNAPVVKWEESRVVTPGDVFGYQTDKGLKLVTKDPLKLFWQGDQSQGLFLEGERAVAGTVTGEIESETERSKEKKSTHIQYDKGRIKQKEADFEIDIENYKERVNYDGGHIIDHKFSAESSHTTESNYFPQHFYYNQHIKEYLVKASRCDAFVEIPLYTPNPPQIGVKGQKEKYHPIPAAIILVQIKDNKIQNIYCFPNNRTDYQKLSDSIEKDKAKVLSSYFQLSPALYRLFLPAIIGATKEEKQDREERFCDLMDDVTLGMSLTECGDDAELIAKLCSDVLHGKSVDPEICLTTPHFDRIKHQPLDLPFNLLGEYLVKYSLRNALKSEVISTESRLIITNVIIDFIEHYHEVSEKALDFIETLAPEFHQTLEDLNAIAPQMKEQELLFLINAVQRLSSPFCHSFLTENRDELFDGDLGHFLCQTGDLLQLYLKNFSIEDLQGAQANHMICILADAKGSLSYLQECGEDDGFENLLPVLSDAAKGALSLLKKDHKSSFKATFLTGLDRGQEVRAGSAFLESQLSSLILDEEDPSSD